MKSLIPFITLSFILLFSTSCEEINEFVLDNTKVLESIERDFDILESYEYDDKERVSRLNIHSSFSNNIIYYYEYEYGKDTVSITYINNSTGNTIEVEKIYNVDRKTVRKNTYENLNGNITLTEYRLYRYNGNACGYSEQERYNADETLRSRLTYAYYNENCSQHIHIYDGNGNLNSMIRIERDGKQPYFASTMLDIYKQGNLGNITSYTYMDADSVIIPTFSYYIDYQYNNYDNGDYPIVESRVYNNGVYIDRKFNYVGVQ